MTDSRIEALKGFVDADPQDTEARYMLALEYRKAGEIETALHALQETMAMFPDYFPAYHMAGQMLGELERLDEAGETLRHGVEAAKRAGDSHAQSEMEDLLASIGESI